MIASERMDTSAKVFRNVQIIDGAVNATFSIFQMTLEEFDLVFPGEGQDLELVSDFVDRVGEEEAGRVLSPVWERPIRKTDVQGIHGTLFYDDKGWILPATKRERDRDPGSMTAAERAMFGV
jgi:hypothetical protein